jgi:putative addiction module component (TIGR02574 family)
MLFDPQRRRIRMRVADIPEIDRLSPSEKILLVEDLWDGIAADESSVPVPQSHKEELDRRLRRYKSHPGNVLSLEKLQGRIERRKCLAEPGGGRSVAKFVKGDVVVIPSNMVNSRLKR